MPEHLAELDIFNKAYFLNTMSLLLTVTPMLFSSLSQSRTSLQSCLHSDRWCRWDKSFARWRILVKSTWGWLNMIPASQTMSLAFRWGMMCASCLTHWAPRSARRLGGHLSNNPSMFQIELVDSVKPYWSEPGPTVAGVRSVIWRPDGLQQAPSEQEHPAHVANEAWHVCLLIDSLSHRNCVFQPSYIHEKTCPSPYTVIHRHVNCVQDPHGQECCAWAGASPTSCNAGWQHQLEKQEGDSDRVKAAVCFFGFSPYSETCMLKWVSLDQIWGLRSNKLQTSHWSPLIRISQNKVTPVCFNGVREQVTTCLGLTCSESKTARRNN